MPLLELSSVDGEDGDSEQPKTAMPANASVHNVSKDLPLSIKPP